MPTGKQTVARLTNLEYSARVSDGSGHSIAKSGSRNEFGLVSYTIKNKYVRQSGGMDEYWSPL